MIAYYQVKFTYKDDKELNINMVPAKLKSFFDCLDIKQIFWFGDEETTPEVGFWTNLDDIRYIHIQAVKGEIDEEPKECKESSTEVHDDKESVPVC